MVGIEGILIWGVSGSKTGSGIDSSSSSAGPSSTNHSVSISSTTGSGSGAIGSNILGLSGKVDLESESTIQTDWSSWKTDSSIPDSTDVSILAVDCSSSTLSGGISFTGVFGTKLL